MNNSLSFTWGDSLDLDLNKKEGLGMPVHKLLKLDEINNIIIPALIQGLPSDLLNRNLGLLMQSRFSRLDKWKILMLYSFFALK